MSDGSFATRKKLADAGIPPQAYTTTLQILDQQELRRIIIERSFYNFGLLHSYIVEAGGKFSRDEDLSVVFSRFACEMLLAGQDVKFMRMAEVLRATKETPWNLTPGIYIAIPDFYVTNMPKNDKEETENFLIEYVTNGGGLLLALQEESDDTSSAEFRAMAKSASFSKLHLR